MKIKLVITLLIILIFSGCMGNIDSLPQPRSYTPEAEPPTMTPQAISQPTSEAISQPTPTLVPTIEATAIQPIVPTVAAMPTPEPQVIILEPVSNGFSATVSGSIEGGAVVAEPQVFTSDWGEEITAVTQNLDNAVAIAQACAIAKVEAAAQFKVMDCTPAAENLELAKQKVAELQQAIYEGGK